MTRANGRSLKFRYACLHQEIRDQGENVMADLLPPAKGSDGDKCASTPIKRPAGTMA